MLSPTATSGRREPVGHPSTAAYLDPSRNLPGTFSVGTGTTRSPPTSPPSTPPSPSGRASRRTRRRRPPTRSASCTTRSSPPCEAWPSRAAPSPRRATLEAGATAGTRTPATSCSASASRASWAASRRRTAAARASPLARLEVEGAHAGRCVCARQDRHVRVAVLGTVVLRLRRFVIANPGVLLCVYIMSGKPMRRCIIHFMPPLHIRWHKVNDTPSQKLHWVSSSNPAVRLGAKNPDGRCHGSTRSMRGVGRYVALR